MAPLVDDFYNTSRNKQWKFTDGLTELEIAYGNGPFENARFRNLWNFEEARQRREKGERS